MSVYPEGLEILVLTFADKGHDYFCFSNCCCWFFFSNEMLHFPKHQLDMVLLDLTALFQI